MKLRNEMKIIDFLIVRLPAGYKSQSPNLFTTETIRKKTIEW
jgi:hypothetical protein